jgi:hypothetical protein
VSTNSLLDRRIERFCALQAMGERAFDVATWAAEHPPTLIAERASVLAESLGLEERRALGWTRVLALLGAAQAVAFDQELASALRAYART